MEIGNLTPRFDWEGLCCLDRRGGRIKHGAVTRLTEAAVGRRSGAEIAIAGKNSEDTEVTPIIGIGVTGFGDRGERTERSDEHSLQWHAILVAHAAGNRSGRLQFVIQVAEVLPRLKRNLFRYWPEFQVDPGRLWERSPGLPRGHCNPPVPLRKSVSPISSGARRQERRSRGMTFDLVTVEMSNQVEDGSGNRCAGVSPIDVPGNGTHAGSRSRRRQNRP